MIRRNNKKINSQFYQMPKDKSPGALWLEPPSSISIPKIGENNKDQQEFPACNGKLQGETIQGVTINEVPKVAILTLCLLVIATHPACSIWWRSRNLHRCKIRICSTISTFVVKTGEPMGLGDTITRNCDCWLKNTITLIIFFFPSFMQRIWILLMV